ncbi:MAG: LamG domain-containing protein [Candidatus Cloacimonetes bacterium]|nr:LamG domain-containing protein [Candidatus Cloacimonadota bacterium]MDY0298499.1 LamG-like jellyroll fold domain-containing protein [Candidatus Cloacimonadaceae bacterium]
MGRAMLIFVVLMTAIYSGILVSMQRRMLDLPRIVQRNMLSKQAESVSDYALRTAVRNSVFLGMMAGPNSVVMWNQEFNGFQIQSCHIDSIYYTFVGEEGEDGSNSYRAISYVSGELQGQTLDYRAEIAFSFPLVAMLDLDYCIHLEMDQPQFNPSENWNHVIDSSEHSNDALFYGDVATRPMGQGVDGWKCASFGGGNGYIMHEGNETMLVNSNFTLISYAKIMAKHPSACLIWLPPDLDDPDYDPLSGGGNTKPTGAIYYDGGNMYFTASTINSVEVTASAAFTPDGKWPHNKDKWHFFALTYDRGKVKGYINGLPVAQATNPLYPFYRPNAIRNEGLYLGRIPSGGTPRQMKGLIDQVGLVPHTMTDAEIWAYYNLVINPADIQYIKD